jgi:hypothetical protein
MGSLRYIYENYSQLGPYGVKWVKTGQKVRG